MALLLRLNTTLALVVAGIGGGVGAIRMRAKVDGLIDDRQTVMRAEAHTVCQMLAVWLRTGDTPAGALDRLAHRTTGIVPGELAEASAQIRSGAPPADVLERLATNRRAVLRPPLPPLRRHLERRRRPRLAWRCPTACASRGIRSPARWHAAASRWRSCSSP